MLPRTCTCILGELGIHGGRFSYLFAFHHQWPPLHLAAEQGRIDVVIYLVEKGANIHSKVDDGVSE